MNLYALSSPNSATLSDSVIGSVAQRTWPARSRKELVEEMPLYRQQPQRHTYRQAPYMRPMAELQTNARDDVTPAQTALTSVVNLMEQTGSSTGCALESVSSIQTAKHPISGERHAAAVVEALKKKKLHHRERCRVNQARYRQRQLKIKNDIQDEIAKLQTEIKELELRGQDPSRLPMPPTIWVLVAEYFRHLRHFLSSPASLQDTAADFLRGMLAPDVAGASSFGVEAQIDNWKLFALYFGDADLELKGMNAPTPHTLVASTSTTVTITSNTLRYVFPHLNSDGNGGAQGGVWSPLAAKMLEQKLVVRGWFTFGWDDSSDQVVRLQARADMLTPMLKLLGSLDDVSCVFENAMVTPECQFVRRG